MNRHQRRSRLIALTLGCALAAPLLMVSTSASTSEGKFQVHAWNTQDPSIEAYAGLKGLASNPGGGTGAPEDTSAEIFSAALFGIDITITEDMLALSEANLKAAAEGRSADIKTHAGGWQTIWKMDGVGNISAGSLSQDEEGFVFLSSSTEIPTIEEIVQFSSLAGNGHGRAMAIRVKSGSNTVIQLIDQRDVKEGATVYARSSPGQSSVTRITRFNGEPVLESIDNLLSENRIYVSYNDLSIRPIQLKAWETKPSQYKIRDGKLKSVTYSYREPRGGYDSIEVSDGSDVETGFTMVTYRNSTKVPNGRDKGTGPDIAYFREGKLYKAWTPETRELEVSSVDEWNAKTGQSWDGFIPDLELPQYEVPPLP